MASIDTTCTRSQRNQSANPSNAEVTVEHPRTSCRRFPDRSGCGTRTHAVNSALPRSNPATRSNKNLESSASSTCSSPPSATHQLPGGRPGGTRGEHQHGLACSKQQCRTLKRLPGPDSRTASTATTVKRPHQGDHPRFSPQHGRAQGHLRLTTGGSAGMAELYPEIEPYGHGMLDVGDGHRVYWETCGN